MRQATFININRMDMNRSKTTVGTVSNKLPGGGGLQLVLRATPHPQFLKWYKTFSWLFGSHDDPLIFQ